MSDHRARTSAEIREQSLIHVLGQNIDLKNQLRTLYTALGLDYEATTHSDAVAVCEALRGLYDQTLGAG